MFMSKDIFKKVYPYIIIGLSAIGMLDTLYLASKSLKGEAVTCAIFNGCDVVLSSSYATFLGLPVSLYGFLYYITVLFLVALIFHAPKKLYYSGILYISTAAFLVSAYLFYIQVEVLESYCLYCIVSLTLTTLIFVASVINFYTETKRYV